MEVTWPSSVPGSGGKKTWTLTQEVILKFAHAQINASTMILPEFLLRPHPTSAQLAWLAKTSLAV